MQDVYGLLGIDIVMCLALAIYMMLRSALSGRAENIAKSVEGKRIFTQLYVSLVTGRKMEQCERSETKKIGNLTVTVSLDVLSMFPKNRCPFRLSRY